MPTIGTHAPDAGTVLRIDVDQDAGRPSDTHDAWSWPPYHHDEPSTPRYVLDEWAPSSVVRRPWVRLGRWTLLYRRP